MVFCLCKNDFDCVKIEDRRIKLCYVIHQYDVIYIKSLNVVEEENS